MVPSRKPPAGKPTEFKRTTSSRVSGSFKKHHGERWEIVPERPGRRRISRESTEKSVLTPKERWWRAFIRSDPRQHLAEYFKAGDQRGPYGYLRALEMRPREGERSEYFSVWRPTSLQAMRMLFEGTAVGKALNIKGKSALEGPLTGFVPFLQISLEEHKKLVRLSPSDARSRVFYQSWDAREAARIALEKVGEEMDEEAVAAEASLSAHKSTMTDSLFDLLGGNDDSGAGDASNWGGLIFKSLDFEKSSRDLTLRLMQLRRDDPKLHDIDTFAYTGVYGLDMPERLLWEAYVQCQDITLKPGMETGRSSEPAYMDLNLQATRDRLKPPLVALWQHDTTNPMNPTTLLMAHEEKHVRPVASDMDPFLIGTKGLLLEQSIPAEQIELMRRTIEKIAEVLEEPREEGWNKRWLEVLCHNDLLSNAKVPKYGFGDPQSYDILAKAISKVEASGAVRHGAEAFNYTFPQALDDEYLVVWSGFEKDMWGNRAAPWKYLKEPQLREFLIGRIEGGYVFPLNPKWILCDHGWDEVWAALCKAGDGAQAALDIWLPRSMRELMGAIQSRHPEGFHTLSGAPVEDVDCAFAEWELRRRKVLKRAQHKMRAIARLIVLGQRMRSLREASEKLAARDQGVDDGDAGQRP